MIACHCHFTEEQINNCSYIFYKDILKELGLKLNFESISALYGNAYAGESFETIQQANPFNYIDKSSIKPQRMTKEMALAFLGQKA